MKLFRGDRFYLADEEVMREIKKLKDEGFTQTEALDLICLKGLYRKGEIKGG